MSRKREQKRKPRRRSGVARIPSETADVTTVRLPWPPIIVALAGILVYVNSFSGVFLFDGTRGIVENESLRDPASFWQHLITDRRPIVWLSLAINYAVSELNVWSYHLVNVVVHVLAALTLYGVIARTLVTDALRASLERSAHWFALAVALLWVTHPLQTQSVTYIIQRGESMMGLFYLLTIYCVVRGANSSRARWWYVAAVLSCAAGMGSKAVMISAPIVVLLYDWAFISRSFALAFRQRWGLYVGLAATWIVLVTTGVAGGVLNPSPGGPATVGFGFKGITPLEYALTQSGVILHYLKLSVYPHPLCLDYGWPVATAAGSIVVPGLVMVAILVATAWALVKRPELGFLGAFFLLILAPTSSFIPIKDIAFEHRMYLPLAAVIVLVVMGAQILLRYVYARLELNSGLARGINVALVCAIAVLFGWGTISRNEDYHSEYAMWSDVVAKQPHNFRARTDLGRSLAAMGRMDDAIEQYEEALRIKPAYSTGQTNLGNALIKLGRFDAGFVHLHEAVRLKPSSIRFLNNLGVGLAKAGRLSEAEEHLERAVHLDADHANSHSNLGNAIAAQGRSAESLPHFLKALELDPSNHDAHNNLAVTMLELDEVDQAIHHFKQAIMLNPEVIDSRVNLATTLRRQGRVDEAIDQFVDALRLQPYNRSAIGQLATLLAEQDRIDEITREFRDLESINTLYAKAQSILGDMRRQQDDITGAEAAYRKALGVDPGNAEAREGLDAILADSD